MNPQQPPKLSLPGVKNVVAVASGKGGVGKSTVAANLALGLHMSGATVGLMDADIYGPSVPIMFGLSTVDPQTTPFPLEKYGIKLMSMGFMVGPEQAVIWRGPKVAQAVQAFLGQINWGNLDYLVIDLPPGTGDAQLTLIQTAPVTGAIVVTTPSEVSLEDARKAIGMFRQVNVKVLGIVENMSYLVIPGSDQRMDVFGQGGGKSSVLARHFANDVVDPSLAVPAQTILNQLAQTEAPGAKPVGSVLAGNFQTGQVLQAQIQMQPGKCYTVLGAGLPPVAEVNLQLTAVSPVPGIGAAVLAQDQTAGLQAVLGQKPNCYKWAWPVAGPVNVTLSVAGGSGCGRGCRPR
jgi:ATP-binding protein involved in chromosome partitioning